MQYADHGIANRALCLYAFIRRGNRLEIWIDGVLTTQSSAMPAVSTFTSTAIQEFMWGTIGAADEAALYPRALSVAEIRQHIVQGLFGSFEIRVGRLTMLRSH